MNVDRTDAEFVQKISKIFMKGGDEKGVNYVYPVDWINPKGETEKGNIMINAEIFLGTLFIETREAKEYGYILKTLSNRSRPGYIKETHLK